MKKLLLLTVLVFMCLTPLAMAQGELPQKAALLADDLDTQLVKKLDLFEKPAKDVSLVVTVPVELGNLEATSPLARQMAEEMAAWFVRAGYKVQEIRKGKNVLFAQQNGEFLLTRRVNLLDNSNVRSALVLIGTYVNTSRSVRFNLRLLHSPSNEILAMSSVTLPMSPEVRELMPAGVSQQLSAIRPSVVTSLGPPMPGQSAMGY